MRIYYTFNDAILWCFYFLDTITNIMTIMYVFSPATNHKYRVKVIETIYMKSCQISNRHTLVQDCIYFWYHQYSTWYNILD